MKDWCYIDIPDWQLVQPALQKFVTESVKNSSEIYNYIDLARFRHNCPEITTLIESYFDSQIERIVVFKMTQESMQRLGHKFIHIDSGLKTARLNWPILNPNSIVTKYFKIVDPEYCPSRHFINPPFKDYIDICDPAVCEEISSVYVNQPTVFNVKTPHGMFQSGNDWPRIIASFNFVDDSNLVKYL